MKKDFYVLIEKDENGYFVGEVPQLRACYVQGRTIDELMKNIREVIELALQDEDLSDDQPKIFDIKKITIHFPSHTGKGQRTSSYPQE